MRFSESWLREWVNPAVDTATLADQLSMAGLEVDAVEPAAPPFSGVVVGAVLALAAHPEADKLRVCQVDAGTDETLQIVCGAANVAAGMRVPVALVGATLPGGLKIKQAKLRGVASMGMICSASELQLAESSEGILPLPADAPVGEDFRAWLALDDQSIELGLTPDRGDCLSVAGVAREVGVINRVPVGGPRIQPVPPRVDDTLPVRLLAPQACPRYACRVVRGIDPDARTPLWMQERLRRSGLRAISPVVDVTNYVLLELGQPMHGFDLAKLSDEIRVRLAQPGEVLALLNGQQLTLTPDSLVIADARGPLALAGIMGGSASAVGEGTRDVLLESAFFAPRAISGKARGYGLHTDSSHRFERGVDPGLAVHALERATRLLMEIAGGAPGPVVDLVDQAHLPGRPVLALRRHRLAKTLGLVLDDAVVEDILTRLGMTLVPTPEGWDVTPPGHRFDLVLEVDLIAEVGRIYGYQRLPVSHAAARALPRAPAELDYDLDRAKLGLVARGWQEVVTYSFVSPELSARIDPDQPPLALANPISADMAVMRTSLWPGLLQTVRQNQARQQMRLRIFESGLRFRRADDGLHQEPMLAGCLVGSVLAEQWGEAKRAADFFDLKAEIEALLAASGWAGAFRFDPALHPALHPGQTARIALDGRPAGLIGMLHPAVAAELDIIGDAFLFELDLTALSSGTLPRFAPLSKFPSIRRDLAVVVDEAVPYDRVRACIEGAASGLLRELLLFDVYRGDGIESGRKSLALGLILQASSQTLTDQEVDGSMARILHALKNEIAGRLRD